MSQGNTVQRAVQAPSDAGARYLQRKLDAAAAVCEGRLSDAHRLILDLLADHDAPIVAGQCRYCHCTDEHPCGIALDDEGGPMVVRCTWYDHARTVCSKLSCLTRYEREQGRVVGEHADPASRIVRP